MAGSAAAASFGWTQQSGEVLRPLQVFWPLDPRGVGFMGRSISIDGDWVMVSSPADDDAPIMNPGAIYMYRRVDDGVQFVRRLVTGSFTNAGTGVRTDLRHGLLAVTSTADPGTGIAGFVSVFDLEDPAMPLVVTFEPDPTRLRTGRYGADVVVLDRDHIVVADAFRTMRVGPEPWDGVSGALLLYGRTASGWVEKAEIFPALDRGLPLEYSTFGYILDFDGQRLAVSSTDVVAIYDWDEAAGSLHLDGWIEGPNYMNFSLRFAPAMAIGGDLLAVSEERQSIGSAYRSRVYLFREGASGWTLERTLFPSDGYMVPLGTNMASEGFGASLDIDEDGRVIVGARAGQRGSASNPDPSVRPGTAYVFEHGPNGWTETFRLWDAEDEHFAAYGSAVALDSDLAVVAAQAAHFPLFPAWRSGLVYFTPIPFGAAVCTGAPNSTGAAGELRITGNRRAASLALDVEARGLPVGASALLLASRETGSTPFLGGGLGTLCLGGAIARFSHDLQSASQDGSCRFEMEGLEVPTPSQGVVTIGAGETWNFQVWYRDGSLSNLTGAVAVEFR